MGRTRAHGGAARLALTALLAAGGGALPHVLGSAGAATTSTLVGVVEQVESGHGPLADPDAAGSTLLRTDQGWLDVEGAVEQVASGTRVRATVRTTADGLEAVRVTTLGQEVPTAPAGAVTRHDVAVVLYAPAGTSPHFWSTADARASAQAAVGYWNEQAAGSAEFSVASVTGWVSGSGTCGSHSSIWNEASSAAGFVPGAGKHLLVYLPEAAYRSAGCSYGLGTIGSSIASGGLTYASTLEPSVAEHELGHNLGLLHSGTATCGSGDWSTSSSQCTVREYGDKVDPLGNGVTSGNVNAHVHDRLGLEPALLPVSAPGRTEVVLAARGSAPAAGTERGLRVTGPSGTPYWVEYRAGIGRDADTGQDDGWGVRVLRQGSGSGQGSLVLDATPALGGGNTVGGTPWSSADGRVQVEVLQEDPTSARVAVTLSTTATTPAPGPARTSQRPVPLPATKRYAAPTPPVTGPPTSAPERGYAQPQLLIGLPLGLVEAGKAHAVSALLVGTDGVALKGVPLEVQRATDAAGTSWTTVGTGKVGATGAVSLRLPPATSTLPVRVRAALPDGSTVTSGTLEPAVYTAVAVTRVHPSVKGSVPTLLGKTRDPGSATLSVEFRTTDRRGKNPGSWQRAAVTPTVVSASAGTVQADLRELPAGAYEVRLVRAATSTQVASQSKPARFAAA